MTERSTPCPAVSVLMPARNAGRYIAKAIASVQAQDCRELELIVVDDGSTDATVAIARGMAKGDARVRVDARSKAGISAARNAALRQARSPLVAWLDADDMAESGRLGRQLDYMHRHPECVVLGAQATLIDEDDDVLGVSAQPLSHEAIEADLWKGLGSAILQPAAMMRKEAVERVGGYREDLQVSEDLDLYLKLAETGRLANLPERLIRFRRHCASVSAVGHALERNNPREAILAEALRRRGLPPRRLELEFPPHPETPSEWHARWAFRALRNGYGGAARKHARKAWRLNPLNPLAWKSLLRTALATRAQGRKDAP